MSNVTRRLSYVMIAQIMILATVATAQPNQQGCIPGDRIHQNVRIVNQDNPSCNDCFNNPPDVLLHLLHKYKPVLKLTTNEGSIGTDCYGGPFGTLSLHNANANQPLYSLLETPNDFALIASEKANNLLLSTRSNRAAIKFATTAEGMVQDVERMRITPQGFVGINTTEPKSILHVQGDVTVGIDCNTKITPGFTNRLSVDGIVLAKEVRVTPLNWSDDVFGPDYVLPSLSDVESHIREHGHLQGIPSEEQATTDGIDVSVMQAALLRKIEELMLYVIELEKKVARLSSVPNGANP